MRGALGETFRASHKSSRGRCPRKKASSPQHPRARGALNKSQGYGEERPYISHLPRFFRRLFELSSRSLTRVKTESLHLQW